MDRSFEEMTSPELAAALSAAKGRAVAILPLAAIEQHGPHLPLGTDAFLADAMAGLSASLLPPDLPATFLPTLRIGKSGEHADFPGTLDATGATLSALIVETGAALARAGFRRLVLVNAHGGNTPAMDGAALELRRSHRMLVATCSWLRFGYPDGLLPLAEIESGIHGGAVETSLMMHFRPDLVRRAAIDAFPSLQDELGASAKRLRAHGRIGFAWTSRDLNPHGVVGDARLASAEIGRAIADHQARAFVELLEDVAAFDLDRLR